MTKFELILCEKNQGAFYDLITKHGGCRAQGWGQPSVGLECDGEKV